MILKPDPDTAVIDPFRPHTTLNLNCWVHDPITHESYSRDPRYVAKKAEEYLKSTGLADTCYIGPEAEFFIFDDVRFEQTPNRGFYQVDSVEAAWNTGTRRRAEPRLQAAHQRGLLPGAADGPVPGPPFGDGAGAPVARHRRRGAAPRGGHRRSGRDRHPLRLAAAAGRQADAVQVRHQERGVGRTARPRRSCRSRSSSDNGSGMHTHQSLVEGRRAAVLRREGLCRSVRHGALVHRRSAQARPFGRRVLEPHHQLLQAVGAGLRGAGEPRVLASGTARRRCASRCTRRARRPSASSSAARIRRATRTSRSRRC